MPENEKNDVDEVIADEFAFTDTVPEAIDTLAEASNILTHQAEALFERCHGAIAGSVEVVAPDPLTQTLSLRDFSAFIEGCPRLVEPALLEEIITLVLDTQRPAGTLAENITFAGEPLYLTPYDDLGAREALDTPQAAVNLVWHAFTFSGNSAFIRDTLSPLSRALRTLPRNPETGLVCAAPDSDNSRHYSMGTERLDKRGDLLIASLLYARACWQMGDLYQSTGEDGQSDMWRAEGDLTAKRTRMYLWDKHAGLFRACTEGHAQHDIWGSSLAVYVNVATSGQLMSIGGYLSKNYDELFYDGHLCHFLPGVTVALADPKGEGQNGGFWSLPVGWAAYSLNIVEPSLADRLIIDLAERQCAEGVFQWISKSGKTGGKDNLASAALPLGGVRRILDKRSQLTA